MIELTESAEKGQDTEPDKPEEDHDIEMPILHKPQKSVSFLVNDDSEDSDAPLSRSPRIAPNSPPDDLKDIVEQPEKERDDSPPSSSPPPAATNPVTESSKVESQKIPENKGPANTTILKNDGKPGYLCTKLAQ
jgi:hypothetical protein